MFMPRRTVAFLVFLALSGGSVPADERGPSHPLHPRYVSGLLLEEKRGRIVVSRVLEGSPAAAAGFRSGDVLLVVDGTALLDLAAVSPAEIMKMIDRARPPVARLVVGRGDSTLGMSLPIGVTASAPTASPQGEIVVGQTAPLFTAKDMSGGDLSLKDLRGRPVLIDFWASWCPPCRDAVVVLRRLADQYGDRLAIVGVSLDEDPRAFEAFVYNHHLPGSQVHDGGPFGPISVLYGAPAASIPYSVLIGSDGKVLEVGHSLTQQEAAIARVTGPAAPDRSSP
jgi:thiol-disulfide isomerase/thioredoxin